MGTRLAARLWVHPGWMVPAGDRAGGSSDLGRSWAGWPSALAVGGGGGRAWKRASEFSVRKQNMAGGTGTEKVYIGDAVFLHRRTASRCGLYAPDSGAEPVTAATVRDRPEGESATKKHLFPGAFFARNPVSGLGVRGAVLPPDEEQDIDQGDQQTAHEDGDLSGTHL